MHVRERLIVLATVSAALFVAAAQQSAPARDLYGAPSAPLGLRYSILKQVAGGRAVEVDPETVFRSGDRIRLGIEANDTAHLYIIQRGSSGNWSLLFPSPEINGGDNRIERRKRYEIPAGYWFAFDEEAGEEKVFVVLGRQPEADLEKLFAALQQQAAKTAAAANSVNDAFVDRLRQQGARELIFEKTQENVSGSGSGAAVYVINRTNATDSRVVADLILHHK